MTLETRVIDHEITGADADCADARCVDKTASYRSIGIPGDFSTEYVAERRGTFLVERIRASIGRRAYGSDASVLESTECGISVAGVNHTVGHLRATPALSLPVALVETVWLCTDDLHHGLGVIIGRLSVPASQDERGNGEHGYAHTASVYPSSRLAQLNASSGGARG